MRWINELHLEYRFAGSRMLRDLLFGEGFKTGALAWRLSIMLEVDSCIAALKEALFRYGKPDIFNTPSH